MALRPESSVSCDIDEYGELVFACDRPGPVISRMPEALSERLGDAPAIRDNPSPQRPGSYPDWNGERAYPDWNGVRAFRKRAARGMKEKA